MTAGSHLVGVVSDTHGHVPNSQKAARVFESFGVDTILHCGDIGSPHIPPLFSNWPTHYVLGNVDWNSRELLDAVQETGHVIHGRFGTLRIGGRAIAFMHGDREEQLTQAIMSGDWDVVCYGHTHVAKHRFEGETLVLNPGALYRARRHTIAVLNLRNLEVTSINVG